MTQQEKYRIWELRQNGLGYKKIAKILNLNEDTVKSHIRRTSKKEPPKPVCEECGKEFKSYASKTRRYCSTHCYAQARCKSNEKIIDTEDIPVPDLGAKHHILRLMKLKPPLLGHLTAA